MAAAFLRPPPGLEFCASKPEIATWPREHCASEVVVGGRDGRRRWWPAGLRSPLQHQPQKQRRVTTMTTH